MSERKICWRVTRYCNLHCSHCLAGHGSARFSDLSSEQRIAALKTMIGADVTRITWTGGEPTLCADLPALLDLCHQSAIESVITTHGLALRPHILHALNKDTDRLRFSFDGLEVTHNTVRGGRFFAKALASLDAALALGFRVEANISVLSCNIAEIPELITLLVDRGVRRIVLLTLMNRESAADNRILAPSQQEFVFLQEAIASQPALVKLGVVQLNNYGDPTDTYIVIEANGEIFICAENADDVSFGNILEARGEEHLRNALDMQTLAHRTF